MPRPRAEVTQTKASSSGVALQDVLSNGLAALIVLTIVVAAFSGPGKEMIGVKSEAQGESSIAVELVGPIDSPRSQAQRVPTDIWFLFSASATEEVPWRFQVVSQETGVLASSSYMDDVAASAYLAHSRAGQPGRWEIRATHPSGAPKSLRGVARLFIDQDDIGEFLVDSEVSAGGNVRIAAVCIAPDGRIDVSIIGSARPGTC